MAQKAEQGWVSGEDVAKEGHAPRTSRNEYKSPLGGTGEVSHSLCLGTKEQPRGSATRYIKSIFRVWGGAWRQLRENLRATRFWVPTGPRPKSARLYYFGLFGLAVWVDIHFRSWNYDEVWVNHPNQSVSCVASAHTPTPATPRQGKTFLVFQSGNSSYFRRPLLAMGSAEASTSGRHSLLVLYGSETGNAQVLLPRRPLAPPWRPAPLRRGRSSPY